MKQELERELKPLYKEMLNNISSNKRLLPQINKP